MKAILKGQHRPLSTYIAGNPGVGKSSLIQRMALQDIKAGRGVCVIDPTGDLVNRLVHWIPKSRVKDTIFFDTDSPIPIDFFSYRNPSERQVLTDQLVALFALDAAPVSKPRLGKLIGTLFDANENGGQFTFLDIHDFLVSKDVRKKAFAKAPHREKQWPEELFKNLKEFQSITERMGNFNEAPTLVTIFGQAQKRLNIWDVMQGKQILLVNLKDTSTDLFIGSLIVAKIQQATFGRRYIPEAERIPFYLYIDECHTIMKYAAPEFEAILTRARKYKLCLIMANQIPEDLPKEIQAKLPTIHTKIRFIGKFRATTDDEDTEFPTIIRTPAFLGPSPASYATIIRKRTVDKYGCNSPQVPHDEEDDTPDSYGPPRDKTL